MITFLRHVLAVLLLEWHSELEKSSTTCHRTLEIVMESRTYLSLGNLIQPDVDCRAEIFRQNMRTNFRGRFLQRYRVALVNTFKLRKMKAGDRDDTAYRAAALWGRNKPSRRRTCPTKEGNLPGCDWGSQWKEEWQRRCGNTRWIMIVWWK